MDYEINKEQYKVLKKFENKKELGCSDLTEKEVKICEELLWGRKFLDMAQRGETYRSINYSAYKINNSGMIAKECYEAKKKIEANSEIIAHMQQIIKPVIFADQGEFVSMEDVINESN